MYGCVVYVCMCGGGVCVGGCVGVCMCVFAYYTHILKCMHSLYKCPFNVKFWFTCSTLNKAQNASRC